MSQMSVVDLKVSYNQCFGPTPSTEKVEDIEAANDRAVIGLNLDDPWLEWKGGIGVAGPQFRRLNCDQKAGSGRGCN